MNFVTLEFFWFFLPFLGVTFLLFKHKEKLNYIFNKEVLKRLSATDEGMSVGVRNSLMMFSIFLFIIALGRPVFEKGDKKVQIEGLTMMVALDISGSMRSEDVFPNRLTFAKKKIAQLFDTMPTDEIGIMAFAYNSFVIAPFSTDKETLKIMLDGVDDSFINMGSTDFSALGELASSLLEEKKPKILVLFSDGGDKKALKGFKEILKESEIELYVVLVGTEKGSPVLDENRKPVRTKEGTIAITQRNDALGEVAKENGGAFVIASNGKEDIKQLALTIRKRYKNKEQGEVTVKQRDEYFYYPLGLGVFLLLLSLSSLPQRRKK